MPMIATVLWWIVLGMLLGWMGSWIFNRTLRTRATAGSVTPAAPVAVAVPAMPATPVAAERVAAQPATAGPAVPEQGGAVASPPTIVVAPATATPVARPRAEAAASASPGLDHAAAAAAGFAPRHEDDLEVIEGIGPRIAALLRAEGIETWRSLAACPAQRLRDVLDLGGPGFRIADPGTWPEQAALAADGRWAALRALQDRLVAGRR